MKKSRKIIYIISFIVIVFILTLTAGFASFQSNLGIEDIKATIRVPADIRITNISNPQGANGGVSNSADYNVKSTETNISLPNATSTVTYKITVVNFGSVEMGILKITGLPSNLKYTLKDYTLESKLCDNTGKCTLGATKEFYITIQYANQQTVPAQTNYNIVLIYDFRAYHTVTYVHFWDNYTPKEVMDGATYKVTFTAKDDLVPGIIVKLGNNVLNASGYTLSGKSLTITNVTNNLTIEKRLWLWEAIRMFNSVSTSGCPSVTSNYANVTGPETTKSLFCTINDDYGTSYYFRGLSTTNYVKFGNYYWRVLRINGDNSVRMVLAGTSPLDNGVANPSALLPTQGGYNATYDSNRSLGYMFGTTATNYAAEHTNTSNSTMKTNIDNWFTNTSGLNTTANKAFLADALFCNDRSLYVNEYNTLFGIPKVVATMNPGSIGTGHVDTALGYGKNQTFYGAFYRLVVPSGTNQYPTLMCRNKNDRFTVSDTTHGNGALTYPIGALTADEVILAGGNYKNDMTNEKFFLYSNYRTWTMTPSFYASYYAGFSVLPTGWMSGATTVKTSYYYRPVINISSKAIVASGTGTKSSYYTLTMS